MTTKGNTLVYALIVIAAASTIFVGLIRFAVSHMQLSFRAEPQQEALHLAEAGIYYYRWYLGKHIDGNPSDAVSAFWQNPENVRGADRDSDGVCDEDEAYEQDYDGTNTVGRFRLCVIPPQEGASAAWITATGWTYKEPHLRRSVRVRMRRPAWSEFVLLTDQALNVTNKSAFFNGSVHSNEGMLMDGVVTGGASASVANYTYGGVVRPGVWTSWSDEKNTIQNSNVFLGAKTFPAAKQDFNKMIVNFTQIADAAKVHYNLDAGPGNFGYHLVFKENGEVTVRIVTRLDKNDPTKIIEEKYKNEKATPTLKLLPYSAIFIKNDVWIEGVIPAGTLLTISAMHEGEGEPRQEGIWINGDLTYGTGSMERTALGIAAEGSIRVVNDPNMGLNNTLDIHGALLAVKGIVGKLSAEGVPKTALNIYGAVAAKQGFVLDGVSTSSLQYDPNFIMIAPPYFPTGDSIVIDQWTELD